MMIATSPGLDLAGSGSAAMGPTASPEEIEAIIESLADEDWRARSEATRRLIEIGEPALPALRQQTVSGPLERVWRTEEAIREIERKRDPAARPPPR